MGGLANAGNFRTRNRGMEAVCPEQWKYDFDNVGLFFLSLDILMA
jgi:hypothetical protein